MYIQEVVLYGRSKEELLSKFPTQFDEIESLVASLNDDGIINHVPNRGPKNPEEITPWKFKSYFEELIEKCGWKESTSYVENSTGRKFYMRMLGFINNRVSLSVSLHRDQLSRWLYTSTPIAYKNGLIDIPFIVLPTKNTNRLFNRHGGMREEFERAISELKALEPLSHAHPFVILGISHEPCETIWTEMESEKGVAENKIIINRSIEFPPEFRQAGLGILNYFGEIVREKYPHEGAKIKIEQDGSNVRMIVEAEDGSREVIEKALEEYELVVTGKAAPETIFDNKAKILELKNELRIAETRIESQRDLIEYQKSDMQELRQLFAQSLSSSSSPELNLTVSPQITVTSSQTNTLNNVIELGEILDDIQGLIERGSEPDMSIVLNDLYESIENTDTHGTPEAVKSSGAMRKFKKFLDDANEAGTKTNDFLSKASDGLETLKCLGAKYNSIAEWCGAPQIPKILL